jgi:MYXO-CTERM domain-containing protein
MRKGYGLVVLFALAGGGRAEAAMNAPDASLASDGDVQAVDAASDVVGSSSDGGPDAHCAPTCPSAEPAVGDPCEQSVECEYGDDPRFECNRTYTCAAGQFQTLLQTLPGDDAGCPTALAAGCPLTRASLTAGAACTPTGLACPYVEGECQCETTADGGSSWSCLPQNSLVGSDAVCPVPRPRLGTSCLLQSDVYCTYETNCSFQVCNPCGEWVLGVVPCGEVPPPLPMDGGTGDSSVGGSLGSDGASAGSSAGMDGASGGDDGSSGNGAVGNGGGCGCGVAGPRSGAGAGAGVILGIALLARRRRSDVSRRLAT